MPMPLRMLWESVNADEALTQRFTFATPDHAADWLAHTLNQTYSLSVTSVDQLIISAYNLLAWVSTPDGPLLAKCCAYLPLHDRLTHVADLLVWLDERHVPVSVPLATPSGQRQVQCEHLTIGLQRALAGEWLDPLDPLQNHAAGVTLAQVHTALAAYPHATDFLQAPPPPPLDTSIQTWLEKNTSRMTDPSLVVSRDGLAQRSRSLPALPSQLIHGDYRAANILWHQGAIAAVLDFEDLRWGYRVNDLAWGAVHLGTLFRQWGAITPEAHAMFVTSYQQSCPLTEAEHQWLPVLMAWHSLHLALGATHESTYAACLAALTTYTRLLETHQTIF